MFLCDKIVQILMTRIREMAKRRFCGAEARDENLDRSPSVEILNNGMNPDQPGIDLEEKRRREHPREAFHFPQPAFTPAAVIPQPQEPSLVDRYQEKYEILLETVAKLQDPKNTENMALLRNANEHIKVMVQTTQGSSYGRSISFQDKSSTAPWSKDTEQIETGDAESSGPSFRAISNIERLILQPLRCSSYQLSNYCDKIDFGREIICLRDLENDLLQVPNVSPLIETYIVTR